LFLSIEPFGLAGLAESVWPIVIACIAAQVYPADFDSRLLQRKRSTSAGTDWVHSHDSAFYNIQILPS